MVSRGFWGVGEIARRFRPLDERGLVGLEARARDGTEVGRISEVMTDEESGEVTHVLV
ncbi:MAG: PRC-barrel domain-containing protein, partial [Actinobacteria bacterium]|nr:PRC-barrel domain-containing protein [Actinomycetota bacterium]